MGRTGAVSAFLPIPLPRPNPGNPPTRPPNPPSQSLCDRTGWHATPKCPRDDSWRKTDARLYISCGPSGRKVAVTNRFAAATSAVLVMVAAVGCSSGQASPKLKSDTLPPGTAVLTISGKDLGVVDTVQCAQVESLTTIRTGDEASGATVMVSNAYQLAAELVRLHDLNGFAGSYDRGLQGNATVTLTGSTYSINGVATGFNIAKPTALTAEPFAIKVAC